MVKPTKQKNTPKKHKDFFHLSTIRIQVNTQELIGSFLIEIPQSRAPFFKALEIRDWNLKDFDVMKKLLAVSENIRKQFDTEIVLYGERVL